MLDPTTPQELRTPGWRGSPLCVKLHEQLLAYRKFHGGLEPRTWLLSVRVAADLVRELRPMLDEKVQAATGIEDLTQLFGLPVELVTDFPQGAILR